MKHALRLAALAAGAFLSACAGLPPTGAPKTRVSPDYEASGDASGVRAFVYGTRTVLEFDNRPIWLSVQDENGVPVRFEREGRYYRLARKLGTFSVWANTRALAFSSPPEVAKAAAPTAAAVPAAPQVVVAPAPAAAAARASAGAPLLVGAERAPADDAETLLKLSAAQLDEVRQAIKTSAGSQVEAKALTARMDRIEAQLVTSATAMVRIQFDTATTDFDVDSAVAHVLVPAAKAAKRINVRGRTDSHVAGEEDPKIALGRALAARKFLVDRGVDGAKIKVFALPAGDFIAPSGTTEGRALNRRVEIELVNRRFAELKQQAVALVEDKP